MTAPLDRLRHIATLGDAAATAEVIRWRERHNEAWCVPPCDVQMPKLSDPPEVRDAAMFAWAQRHVQAHGAFFDGAWQHATLPRCVYYAASVNTGGEWRTVAMLLTSDGPRMFEGGDDFPPDTHCAHTDAIWMGARRGICGAYAPPRFRSGRSCHDLSLPQPLLSSPEIP